MEGRKSVHINIKQHGLRGGAVVKGAVLQSLGSRPGSVVTGRDREVRGATHNWPSVVRHNWPSVVRVREGLVGRDVLVSSRTSDSCGGPGRALTKVARCTVFPPTHWCGWLPKGWRRAVLGSSAAWLGFGGRMAFDLRLSRARKGVVAMRQDSNY